MKMVSMMLKAIHSQKSKDDARVKAQLVAEKLWEMKLSSVTKELEDGIEKTLTYVDFPTQHWTRILTNNTKKRLNRETKRRTKAISAFSDGQSTLMLVCARLRHLAVNQWGAKWIDHLRGMEAEVGYDDRAG